MEHTCRCTQDAPRTTSGPLMATDALGRTTPDRSAGVPAPRENRLVGLFYFLWLGEHGRHRPYNVSEIAAADPQAGYKPDSDVWGGIGTYHHWGEPFYGYYYSDDEWVVRHHMKLIMQTGIDFLFFDTTNGVIYEHNVKLVMRVLQEYHDEGWKIPQVMFYTNTASGKTVQQIYDKIYKPGYARDTWFCLDGKPVIIAVEAECSPECRDFFNIKMSQWPNEPDKLGGWPWMDFTRPQRVFSNLQGVPEIINVSVAQHPQLRFGDSVLYGETHNCGRAFHDGRNDPAPDAWKKGYNFAEQFDRAVETDPPIVLVTGWNEWIAGRWQGIPERPIMFVDCANYEYSRDLEMMRGGYFDNYFMQLTEYVRRYKGVEDTPVFGRLPVPEGASVGCFRDADAVFDSFDDGDFARHAEGYGCVYDNRTQRNAIRKIKVKHDGEYLCFLLRTKQPVTPYDGTGSWMRLYLNTEGGQGYQFVLNTHPTPDGRTTLARVTGSGDDLTAADLPDAVAFYETDGDRFKIKVPLRALGLNPDGFTVWFKAADSWEPICSVEDFYEKGDAAPLGRMNFVYRGK
jgi:hypothetical protein